jgi:hypothetical protein
MLEPASAALEPWTIVIDVKVMDSQITDIAAQGPF